MKQHFLGGIAVLALTCAPMQAGVVTLDINAQLSAQNCTGANSTCTVTQTMGTKITGAAQAIIIDVPQMRQSQSSLYHNLGSVIEENGQTVNFPLNQYSVYSLSPTQGPLAGKTINLALKRISAAPGTKLAGNDVIDLEVQLDGWDKNKWAWAGTMFAPSLTQKPFDFEPDGTVKTGGGGKIWNFDLSELIQRAQKVFNQ